MTTYEINEMLEKVTDIRLSTSAMGNADIFVFIDLIVKDLIDTKKALVETADRLCTVAEERDTAKRHANDLEAKAIGNTLIVDEDDEALLEVCHRFNASADDLEQTLLLFERFADRDWDTVEIESVLEYEDILKNYSVDEISDALAVAAEVDYVGIDIDEISELAEKAEKFDEICNICY